MNTGHRRAITALAYDGVDRLYSGSEDGLLVGWDTTTARPVSRIQLSHLPIRAIAVHPRLPHVAVVESDLGQNRLSVWDHRGGRRLFVRELDTPPGQLQYSSTGKYLVMTQERQTGVVFLDPLTGEVLPIFTAGFGIVSFVRFNSDDTVMMSYQPGGDVRYWNLDTQRQRPPVIRTEAFLSPLRVTGSEETPLSLLVGSTGRQLILADITQNGAIRERLPMEDIVSLTATPRGDIALLSRLPMGEDGQGGGTILTRLKYRPGGGLLPVQVERVDSAIWGVPTLVVGTAENLFAGTTDGTILTRSPGSPGRVFGRNTLAGVTDLAILGDTLLVALPGAILSFDTAPLDLILPPADPATATAPDMGVSRTVVASPSPRLSVSARGEVWIWSPDVEPATLTLHRPAGPAVQYNFASALRSVSTAGSEFFAVERTGRVSILSRIPDASGGLVEVFRYQAPGAAVMVGDSRAVLIGRAAVRSGDSAILMVDRVTGETVPLPAEDSLVYDLHMDPGGEDVLSLGVTGAGTGGARTTLRRYTGPPYLGSTVISTYRGEDTGAYIAADGPRGTHYTSLGFTVWREQGAGVWVRQRSAERTPRRLAAAARFVAGLNGDGTITIWDPGTLEAVVDLYVFRDGEWLAAAGPGGHVGSAGAGRYLTQAAVDVPDTWP